MTLSGTQAGGHDASTSAADASTAASIVDGNVPPSPPDVFAPLPTCGPDVHPGCACSEAAATCVAQGKYCGCALRECAGDPPKSCVDLGIDCGIAGDGLGGILDCGGCGARQTCVQNHCVGPDAGCLPKTCATLGVLCGNADNGCGGKLDCGSCTHWGCDDLPPACAFAAPVANGPCPTEGLACPYMLLQRAGGCCSSTAECRSGTWAFPSSCLP
jgi:hypothetical protein